MEQPEQVPQLERPSVSVTLASQSSPGNALCAMESECSCPLSCMVPSVIMTGVVMPCTLESTEDR